MIKILHLEKERYSNSSLQMLDRNFETTYVNINQQLDLLSHLERNKYNAIFTRLGLAIDATVFQLQPNLKYIITPTTGLNHVDLILARKNNVEVISLKGEEELLKTVRSTAEHTWMLILALIRNLPGSFESVKKNLWDRGPFLSEELDGKTLGIIGYGRLGKMIANYALPFNLNVLATDIDINAFKTKSDHVTITDLDVLLAQSDIISLHIPSNESNTNFIDKSKFLQMKKDVFFINTSRGEVVDEQALLEALSSNKIKGAAVDVLENDSIWNLSSPSDQILVNYAKKNSNLIITPHMGGYGVTSIEKTRDFITKKFFTCYEKC